MANITWKKPTGEWGIKGLDLASLPPLAYAAAYKLMKIEHCWDLTRAELLRHMTDEQLRDLIYEHCVEAVDFCQRRPECDTDTLDNFDENKCKACLLEWLQSVPKAEPPQTEPQCTGWLERRFMEVV